MEVDATDSRLTVGEAAVCVLYRLWFDFGATDQVSRTELVETGRLDAVIKGGRPFSVFSFEAVDLAGLGGREGESFEEEATPEMPDVLLKFGRFAVDVGFFDLIVARACFACRLTGSTDDVDAELSYSELDPSLLPPRLRFLLEGAGTEISAGLSPFPSPLRRAFGRVEVMKVWRMAMHRVFVRTSCSFALICVRICSIAELS